MPTRAPPLLTDSLRTLRTSALVWVVAGGLVMFAMGAAIATEMADFPGGPRALAASVTATAEAMRVLRWPAERLDTLGGYVTYHNVIFVNLCLAVYGAVQGARAVRGAEERHALEEVLATGVSRRQVVRDRTLAFAIAIAAISVGLAVGVEAGLAVGDASDPVGSLVTLGATGLVSLVAYGVGLLLAQLLGTVRSAGGTAALVVTGLYVAANLGDELGPLAFLQYLSPFTYANRSRALVPGHGFDPAATVVLLAMAAALLVAGTWAFCRRDYAARLWVRRPRAPTRVGPGRRQATVPTTMLGSVWAATLRRGAWGLLVWALGAAVLTGLLAAMQPAVMDLWSAFDFIGALAGGGPGTTAEAAYWSYAGAIVTPVVAAYVITQAAGWVADLSEGRVEALLAGPVSWPGLVRGRLVALAWGVGIITVAGLGALTAVGAAVGSTPDPAGLARLAIACLLFGMALGGIAAVLVAWLRMRAAVTALAVVVGVSYVLAYLVPLLDWPYWVNRLSVFWAFGQPYLQWPATAGIALLVTLAVPGAAAAMAIAERTPKVV